VVYKLPAATHISVITRDGKRVVAVHRESANRSGHRHEIEIVSLETGRRIASGRPLELGADGASKALDFRVNHWGDGMTHAFGVKGGEWDKKENQRTPDVEASYDLITGKFSDQHPIPDLFEQRKRYQILADAGARIDFLRVALDSNAIQVWRAGKPRGVELDQPLASYDPKSLQGIVAADGSAWFAIKVDPVNPEAVARKKADPEYLDVFHVGTDTKAIRKARVLAPKIRHWFGLIANDRLWLIERNTGFERGGRALVVYQLD
jgi:carotenoid cleavage dioxygenase-like enzyme